MYIEEEDARAEVKLRTTLEELASNCVKYVAITKNSLTGPGTGKTKLDKERMKLCEREIVSVTMLLYYVYRIWQSINVKSDNSRIDIFSCFFFCHV